MIEDMVAYKKEWYKKNWMRLLEKQKNYNRTNHERYLEYQKGIKLKYFEEGRCIRCSSPLIEEEVRYCMACRARGGRV